MSRKPSQSRKRHRERIARKELAPLSLLIKAMFDDISGGLNNTTLPFAYYYDRLDPKFDKCINDSPWHSEIDGDFYFVFERGRHIYVVFGDATGHLDYAGGIKLFVAVALKRLLDQSWKAKRQPTAEQVVKQLNSEFDRVGAAALKRNKDEPLEHGASIIVVRISLNEKSADFASAGIPVRAVEHNGAVKCFGTMMDTRKSLLFPKKIPSPKPLPVESGAIALQDNVFLVFVTDGFEKLGRLKKVRSRKRAEKMGPECIEEALRSVFKRKKRRPANATMLVEAVVAAARRWRKGHFIPEHGDDDRLVLVCGPLVWR